MLCAASPFGMSRIKRTQVRAAFCFSFFCFFRSTHVNQNTAAFFSLSVTRTVYAQSVSRSRMRKIPAHKKIILFYAILPVLSSAPVSLCTEFGHTAEVLFPYSPDFLCSVRRFSKNGRRFLPFCTENSRSGPLFPAFSEKF